MAYVGTASAGKILTATGDAAGSTFLSIGTDSNLQNHGVVIAQGNSAFVAINPGTAGQVLVSNGAAMDPSFQAASGGLLPWTDETSSKNMTANNGYTVSGAGVVLTIPPTVPYGSVFRIAGNGNTWTVNYSSGQLIHIGNQTTTVTTGSLVSTGNYDAIEILCVVANTTFAVINGPQGNITVN